MATSLYLEKLGIRIMRHQSFRDDGMLMFDFQNRASMILLETF